MKLKYPTTTVRSAIVGKFLLNKCLIYDHLRALTISHFAMRIFTSHTNWLLHICTFLTRICIHLWVFLCANTQNVCSKIGISCTASIGCTCVNANSVYRYILHTRWHIIKVFVVLLALKVSKDIPRTYKHYIQLHIKEKLISMCILHSMAFVFGDTCEVIRAMFTRAIESLSFSSWGIQSTPGASLHKQILYDFTNT